MTASTPTDATGRTSLSAGTAVGLSTQHSALSTVLRFYRAKPLGGFGLTVLALFVLMGVFAPWLAPYDYQETDVLNRLKGSSLAHPMGTDNLGRDLLSRIIQGARVEMFVGLGAVVVAVALALLIGLASGYLGGAVDLSLQRLIDVWMAFPGIILLITIITMFQPGLWQVTVAIGLLLTAGASRVVRAATLDVKSRTYVEAARALGATDARVVLHHIVPNIFAPLMVVATTLLGLAILLEATLSFLGYGVPPPEPSWGALLGPEARKDMLKAPMLSVWPGIAIFLAVYSFNVLGDSLRDVLDPRLRGTR
jgi:peptide/nickel transport system permease protein